MTRVTPKNSGESGTVLLTTLLIMAVMAAVAVAIIDDIRFAVKRMSNVNDYAQLDWYVKGAEDLRAVMFKAIWRSCPPKAKTSP